MGEFILGFWLVLGVLLLLVVVMGGEPEQRQARRRTLFRVMLSATLVSGAFGAWLLLDGTVNNNVRGLICATGAAAGIAGMGVLVAASGSLGSLLSNRE